MINSYDLFALLGMGVCGCLVLVGAYLFIGAIVGVIESLVVRFFSKDEEGGQ
jgi:hypothetical protein